jgi:SRSO17 transposase
MGSSDERRSLVIRGRTISEADIEIVRELIAEHPQRGVTYLSRAVAERWGWRQPNGRLKDRACRAVLAVLASRGIIELAPLIRPKVEKATDVSPTSSPIPHVQTAPLEGSLGEFLPFHFEVVSDEANHRLWNHVMREFHYLGYRVLVGRSLKYLVYTGSRLIAALGWQSAVGHLACRDHVIGWDASQRREHLHRVANNARFLIMPWVRIRHAGSHILGRNIARLNQDWEAKYGYQLWLLEGFVDPSSYRGTCYRASNWVCIGETKGFRKEKEGFVYHGATKEVYLYVLDKRMRQKIHADVSAPLLTREFLLSMRVKSQPPSKRREKLILRHEGWRPDVEPDCKLTPEDIDHLADELEAFHRLFEGAFRRVEQIGLSRRYLQGLLTDLERKSVEPIALALDGPSEVRNLQRFMKDYKWSLAYLRQVYWQETSETIAAPDGVISADSSEFPKKGTESVGVSRQYCGRLGKVENCQSGVFVGYSSSRGYAILDQRLFMPEKWFSEDYEERREKCKVPDDLTFETKPEIAVQSIRHLCESGLFPARWVAGDTVFGNSPAFVNNLPEDLYYLVEVVRTTKVWTEPLARSKTASASRRSLSDIAQDPALPWSRKVLAEGAKGPIVGEVARLRVRLSEEGDPNDELWLFLRKDPFSGKIKHCLSNAPADVSLDEMVRVCTLRWPIEQLFEEGKSELGMDHYEHRSWPAWHRHMAYVALAQLFLLRIRISLKKKLQH